ncbi:MAG: DUF58 domain-containing protein [Longimicrobiales bacterium]|nr:DUF58 domain-containing protein [Longimicrobiales bacterium]
MRSALALAARVVARAREIWREIRAWRRISFTAGGAAFTAGAFAVGLAAMNTGNNLLYLLLGAMLGFIAVSGWLSEQAIRALRIERQLSRAVSVGQELRIVYRITNLKGRLPSMAVEIVEGALPGRAFLAHVEAGGTVQARSLNTFVRRGAYRLGTVTLSTSFPFGMFRKERDLELPAELLVWPRTHRPVQAPSPGGGRVPRMNATAAGAQGHRGEYRSLRAYRAGDDPRDIHWRSSARLREPVLREYERDGAETRWICLDLRADPGDPAEVAVEAAASLAAQSMVEGRSFGLVAGSAVVEAGEGAAQLERVLDVLARVGFEPEGPLPTPPPGRDACILVSVDGAPGFPDALVIGRAARFEEPTPSPEGVVAA